MKVFKDREGREWWLDVNGFTLERVKAVCGVYLPGLFDVEMKGLAHFVEDDGKVCSAVWELCRDRAEKDGLTQDDLRRMWAGEYADAATDALLGDLVDFFRNPKRREALRKVVEKIRQAGMALLDESIAEIDGVTQAEIGAGVEKVIARLRASANGSSVSSGNSAAS